MRNGEKPSRHDIYTWNLRNDTDADFVTTVIDGFGVQWMMQQVAATGDVALAKP